MELEELGIREECGVFGCIASGAWPTELDVPHVLTLGLVGLQHRNQATETEQYLNIFRRLLAIADGSITMIQ
ncbi:PPAT isoform 5 [Pitangus sulphuratus]|nr:PPAT isoform 5 [Pitangus sulphuratus]